MNYHGISLLLISFSLMMLTPNQEAEAATNFSQPFTNNAEKEHIVYDTSFFDGMDYRMIGPYRGGRSTAVTGVAGHSATFYMGATGGGVWKTTNNGEDWKNISDGYFKVSSIGGIDVADSDPSVIYVGTGSACMRGNIQTGRGVYKSTDGGRSWSFVGLKEAGVIGKVAIHPDNPDVVYVAAVGHPFGKNKQRGVFRTTDGGETWEKVLYISDKTGAVDVALNPENPREIYAGLWTAERKPWTMISGSKEGGIYKSSDGGDHWSRLRGGLPQGLVGKTSIAVSPAKPSRVWALIEAPEPQGGLYRSDDHGKTWKQINDNRKHLQRAWYYIHIYADPKDENTLYSLNARFYKSVDGGKSFEQYGVPHGDVHDLWVNPNDPKRMVVANDGGAQVSVDGGETWSTYHNQPTAELYSVTVDDEFPYRVYGPQQDNSTIRLPAWSEGSVHPKSNWTEVGGCETGPVALHPDRPWIVFSGCYGGLVTRWNERTGQSMNVMVYPQLQIGMAPRDVRERFQWNAPIVVSPHNPDVVYNASQHIWRSTDLGVNWTRISDDLTTDTPAHQDYAGEPITKDNTGVEVYNTVFSLRVSPHSAETLWAGTDDGLVWISRDQGSNWTQITPEELPQYGTVQNIEVSPHQPGKAYIAVHRYRLDDWKPYVFRTTDYGRSWTRIADGNHGIPDDYPTWVVREDPKREGLLYAGTEFGLFVSFDDGENWQSLQQNLPVTRIPDMKVHDNDLVVATHGRSFWIMDDLSPLRQLNDQVAAREMHLYSPEPAYRVNPVSGGDAEGREPEGREGGAAFDYYFAEKPDKTVTLDILDENGALIRSFTTDSAKAKKDDEPVLPVKKGHTRFHWDLLSTGVDTLGETLFWETSTTEGVRVLPGTYRVRLRVKGEEAQTRTFEVRMDPRVKDVKLEDLQIRHEMAYEIQDSLNRIYDAIRTIRSVRGQVARIASNAQEAGHETSKLQQLSEAIASELSAVEKELIQVKNESHQDPLNFPPKLKSQYAFLYGYVNGNSPMFRGPVPPTDIVRERLAELNGKWMEIMKRLQHVLDDEVESFNRQIREMGDPVFIPEWDKR
jgi:photosystem II stability/assembly factor-like uncharacterized protein